MGKANPLTIFIYIFSIIIITMLTMNPIFIYITFISGCLYSLTLKPVKNIFKVIVIMVIVILIATITNALFNSLGNTVLLKLANKAITLEALYYGFNTGIMLIGIVLWFHIFNNLFTIDKYKYLFGSIAPSLASIFSFSMKLIPELIRRIKELNDAQKASGQLSGKKIIARIKTRFDVFGNLISQTIETSLVTAQAMKARGYGLKNKTQFAVYKFTIKDLIMIIFNMAIVLTIFIFGQMFIFAFNYYPTISNPFMGKEAFMHYGLYFLLTFYPIFINIKEMCKWKYLNSKISTLPTH